MASFEIKGIVKHVGPTVETGTERKFRKRDLILTIDYEGDYPQTILIEAAQDKCDDANLNSCVPGDIVTVSGNFRGREWFNEKKGLTQVFNTLSLWKIAIETKKKTAAGAPPVYSVPSDYTPPANLNTEANEETDLPF